MSKTMQLAAGLVLAAIGFGLGFYAGVPADSAGAPTDSRTASQESPDSPSSPDTNSRVAHARTADPAAGSAAVTVGEHGDDAILDALREAEAFRRAARLATLLPTLGPEYASRARTALKNPRLNLGPVESILLARFWGTHEPAAAGQWAVSDSPLAYRTAVIVPTVELWARVAPEAAAQKVQTMGLLKGPGYEIGQIVLVRGWFDSGLPGLPDYIRNLGLTAERQRALGVFARKLIQRDGAQAAMRWVESLSELDDPNSPDDDARFKLEASRQLGSELAQLDPAAAVAWCEAQCEGPFGSMLRKLVAQRWAAQDPVPALIWLSTGPAGKERDWAVKAALTAWWREDRAGVDEWMAPMATEGVPAWLQPALDLYAKWIAFLRPEEATEWAALLDDPSKREQTLITVARRWHLRDPAAANTWLDQSALSPDAREKARAEPPPRKHGRTPKPRGNRAAIATPAP